MKDVGALEPEAGDLALPTPSYSPPESASLGLPYLRVSRVSLGDNADAALLQDVTSRREAAAESSWHGLLDKNSAKSAVRNANRTNEALVFAQYLQNAPRVRAAHNQGLWSTFRLGSDRTLLSIHSALPLSAARGVLQAALRQLAGGGPSETEVEPEIPNLAQLRAALVEGRDTEFLHDVQQRLHSLVSQVSSTPKFQRAKLGGLLAVLHYASPKTVLPAIEGILREALATMATGVKASRAAHAAREVDSCLYLAFELYTDAQVTWFLQLADTVADASERTGLAWPLFCRGMRQSFMKAIKASCQGSGVQRLVTSTLTEDAVCLRLACAAFTEAADSGITHSIDKSLPGRVLALSQEAGRCFGERFAQKRSDAAAQVVGTAPLFLRSLRGPTGPRKASA